MPQVPPVCEVWPAHQAALRLFLACLSQMEMVTGAAGVVYCSARSVNVQQELQWLDLPVGIHAETVALYRSIERAAINILNAD